MSDPAPCLIPHCFPPRFLERTEIGKIQRVNNFAGDPQELLNTVPNHHPNYTAGNVLVSSLSDAMMCQEFFRPFISEIIRQMISGEGTGQLFRMDLPRRLIVCSSFSFVLLSSPIARIDPM